MKLALQLALAFAPYVATAACGAPAPRSESPARPPPTVTNDDRARVIATIARERTAGGLPPVIVLDDAPPLDTAAEMIRRGAPPEQAVQVAIERVVELESSEARAFCIPAESLDAVELPSVVLERKEVRLAVVAVRKPEGAPPPAFVVCIMVLEDGSDFQGRGD